MRLLRKRLAEPDVAHQGARRGDHELRDEEDGAADRVQRRHAPQVPQDEEEALARGRAEGVAEDGRLDVGLLVDELHALLEAPDAALEAEEDDARDLLLHALDRPVARRVDGVLALALDVHEDRLDDLDDGDNKTAEGRRAGVVPRRVPRREDDGRVADGAPVPREVVRRGRGGDDDLAERLDELHGPEQVEEHEPEGALLVLRDLERLVGHLQRAVGILIYEDLLPGRRDEDDVDEPHDQEDGDADALDDGQHHDEHHGIHDLGGLLHDAHGQHDLRRMQQTAQKKIAAQNQQT